MPKKHPDVDVYFKSNRSFHGAQTALRRILLQTDLKECLKWRQPCYVHQDKNIVLIGAFKTGATLSFFQGSLLKDPAQKLVTPGKDSQAARYLLFDDAQDVLKHEKLIQDYIAEAVSLRERGKKVSLKTLSDYDVPEELVAFYRSNPEFKAAFESLTPGRQKGFLLHYGNAKQSATRTKRIVNSVERVMAGKGLQDCICGRSKRMPRCDGSHAR